MCYKCMLLGAAVRGSCFDLSRLREGDFFFSEAPPGALIDASAERYLKPVLGRLLGAGCAMAPVKVDGDGNCLVHAISRALGGNELFYAVLRQKMFRELCDHKAFYRRAMGGAWVEDGEEGFEGELRRSMPTSRAVSWLSPLHIFALSNVLRRPIVLFDGSTEAAPGGRNSCGIYVPSRHSPEQCRLAYSTNELPSPIAIAWSSRSLNHYVCLSCVMPTPRVPVGGGLLAPGDGLCGTRRALLELRKCVSSSADTLHRRCLEFLLKVVDDCCGSRVNKVPMFRLDKRQCMSHPDFPDLCKVATGVRIFLASIGFVMEPAGTLMPLDAPTRFKDDILAKNVAPTSAGLRALLIAHQSSFSETCHVDADGEALSQLVLALSQPSAVQVEIKTGAGNGNGGRLGIVADDSMTIARTHRRGLMCLGKLAAIALDDPRPITAKTKASYNSLIDILRRVLVSPDMTHAAMVGIGSMGDASEEAPLFSSSSVPVRLCLRVLDAQLATKDAPADPPDVGLGLVGVKNAIRCVSNAMAVHAGQNTTAADTPLTHCTLDVAETTMHHLSTVADRVEAIIRRKCKIANADEKKARHAKGICHAASILVENASIAFFIRRRRGIQRKSVPASHEDASDGAKRAEHDAEEEKEAKKAERTLRDTARAAMGIATAYLIKSKKAGLPLEGYGLIDGGMLRGIHTVLFGDRGRGSKLVEHAVFGRGLVEALEGRSGRLVHTVLADCNVPHATTDDDAQDGSEDERIMHVPVVNVSLMAMAKMLIREELTHTSAGYKKTCPGDGCGSVCAASKEQVESGVRFVCPTCGTAIVFEKTDAMGKIYEGSGCALYPQTIPFGLDEGLFGSVQFSPGLTCAVQKGDEGCSAREDENAGAMPTPGGEEKQGKKGDDDNNSTDPWMLVRKYANTANGWRFGTGDDLMASVLSVQHDLESAFEDLTGRSWEAAKHEDFSRMCTCQKCGTVYYSPVTDHLGKPLDDPRKISDHAEWAIRIQPCPTCQGVDIEGETLHHMSKMMRFHDTVMAVHTAGASAASSALAEEVVAAAEAHRSVWACSICGKDDNRAIFPHCEACRVRREFK